MMEKFKPIICVFILIVCGLYLATSQTDSDFVKIKKWAHSREFQVVEIEYSDLDYGPFVFVGANDRVYSIKLIKDGKMQEGYSRIGSGILWSNVDVEIFPMSDGEEK